MLRKNVRLLILSRPKERKGQERPCLLKCVSKAKIGREFGDQKARQIFKAKALEC